MGEELMLTKARRCSNTLTAVKVKAAGPGKHHDGGGLGLYLRVEPNLSRFWVQRITIHGKRSEIGLGSPPLVSFADARDAATENKRLVRETLIFSDAVDRYQKKQAG